VRRSPKVHPNSAAAKARCQGDSCLKQGAGVVIRIRILPNLTVDRKRLCDRCGKAAGYTRASNLPLLSH